MTLSMILFSIYVLLLLLAFIYSYYTKISLKIYVILVVTVIVRSLAIILSNGVTNFDLDAYHTIGQAFLGHADIFPTPANLYYPYFPVFIYLEAIAVWLSSFHISYILFIKCICLFFELGIVYLLFLLYPKNTNIALLYAINPITTLVSGFQGQFDSLPLFFLLLAYYFFLKKREIEAFSIASFAVAIKTWPLFFFIPLISHSKEKKYVPLLFVMPILVTFLYAFFFHDNAMDIFKTVYTYRGIVGNYGIGYLLIQTPLAQLVTTQGTLISNLILLITGIWIILRKSASVFQDCLFLMLVFFVISMGFGVQWLSWIVPFLIIYRIRYTLIFFIVSTLYIGLTYMTWLQITFVPTVIVSTLLTILMLMVWSVVCIMSYTYSKSLQNYG